ncbi:MAG: DM13 domain-containing protein [Nitrososphaeraceae archaeon]
MESLQNGKIATTNIRTTRKLTSVWMGDRVYELSVLFLSLMVITLLSAFSAFQPTDAQEQLQQQPVSALSGQFMGAGDGIHNAEGIAKEITLEDGKKFIRFENFKVTNGPDLFVYLATDKSASDFVDIGSLKANNGNQNYEVPEETGLTKYDTVLIWCKAFSVLFGSADLKSQ